jgi:O-antigen/teichoic acid export membrane protein
MLEKKKLSEHLKIESKDALIYSLTTFITGIGSFLIVPLFWNKLTPADYGIIAVTGIVASFLPSLLTLSLNQSITRLYYDWPENKRRDKVGSIWIFSIVSTIILGSIFFIIFFTFSKFIFPVVPFFPYIFFSLIITVLSSFNLIPYSVIRIRRLPKVFAAFRISTFTIQMSFSIYFILFSETGVIGYYYSQLITNSIVLIGMFFFMIKTSNLILVKAHVAEALDFSLPLILTSVVANISQILDRFILQHFASLELIGYYSISLKFSSIINQLQSALKLSYGPFLFKTIKEDKISGLKIASKMTSFYIFPLFVLGLCIMLFIDDFVMIFGTENYLRVSTIVPFLVVITLLSSLNVYLAPGIGISKKTKYSIIPVSIQLIVTLFCGLLLIREFEITGIIITNFLGNLVFLLVSLYLTMRLIKWRNDYIYITLLFLTIITFSFLDFLLADFGGRIGKIVINFIMIFIFIFCGSSYLRKQSK